MMIADPVYLPRSTSETRIYLFENNTNGFCGFMEHVAGQTMWRFDDAVMMLALHERLFVALDHPQANCELRMVEKPGRRKKKLYDIAVDKSELPTDCKPTFILNVLYRQNASWQGTVQWIEGGVEKKFRSALELIRIMDSAVNDREEQWQ